MSVRVDRVVAILLRLSAAELAELRARLNEPPPPDAGVREPRRPPPAAPQAEVGFPARPE